MLTVIIRAIIIFVVLLVVIRMMGKRQIGEMEPFELTITLVIAELACIPMADKSVPLTFGIVSILTMYVVHQLIILLTRRSKKLQNVLSGTPVIVIDKNGIKYQALKSMNMQVYDLLQAMRTAGYFSVDEVAYAVFETNGQLSVIPYPKTKQGNEDEVALPVPVLVDGEWSPQDLKYYSLEKSFLEEALSRNGVRAEELLLVTIDDNGKMLIHPKDKKYFVVNIGGEVHYG